MHAEVERALHILADGLVNALGEALLGIYVTGSAVTPEFDPHASDIDLFVVTRSPLSPGQINALRTLHEDLERCDPWTRRLEVQYASRDQLRPHGIEGEAPAWRLGRGFRVEPSVAGADDILGVREFGRAVLGPPPRAVFPPVDEETYLASTWDYLEDLLTRHVTRPGASDGDFADWILNIARCLYRLETRTLGSKRAALEWLAGKEPGLRSALEAAAAARAGDPEALRACRQQFVPFARRAREVSAGLVERPASSR